MEQAVSQTLENGRDGGGSVEQLQSQQQPSGTGRSIRPGITVPPTVLVTGLDNGTLILQGRPDGPRVWLEPADAGPLRRVLAAAFGCTELAAAGHGQDNAR